MHAVRVERASARPEDLDGRVLCHELRGDDGRVAFAKGRILSSEDVPLALSLPWSELHLAVLENGDVHEDDAGARVARATAGDGVEVRGASGGHWSLAATRRGVLTVETAALERVNALDGPCVYTLLDGQVVERAEVVARAKVLPFAVPEQVLADVDTIVRPLDGLVRVARFRDAVSEKVTWFGSSLCAVETPLPDVDAIVTALMRVRDAGSEVVLIAGTKAMDLLDPTFSALERTGARMVRHGVPAHPGSLLWLAAWNGVSIVGMPTCGLFAQATVFDLVIARVLTGERPGALELARLGHGGFLIRDMAFRLPAYRATAERGTVE